MVAVAKGLAFGWARALLALGCAATVAMLASAGPAWAITPTISESSAGLNAGSKPFAIAAGPDGNLWFTDIGSTQAIGRINLTTQAISEFGTANGLNAGSSPRGIAAGADGNLWFTDFGSTRAIGQINPATHAISEFGTANGLNAGSVPNGIAAGADGNLWFADSGSTRAIGMINPTTHAISEFGTANGLNAGSSPQGIAAGPDGNLWFTDQGSTPAIGRINPTTHAINEFSAGLSAGSSPGLITAGPDGNLWFTDQGSTPAIGRINPTTQAINEFSSGLSAGSTPNGIAAGADGNLWFPDRGTKAIGRINPTTQAINEFSAGLNAGSTPQAIAAGADGNLWFTDQGSTKAIGRITTPPLAVTGGAVVLGSGAATVAGTVNGHAQPTTDRFEFGPTPGYGSSTPAASAGSGFANVPASATLTGLLPNTTYHYRVDATNPTDATPGADATFTTLALPTVGSVTVKPKTWRRGSKLPQISKKRRRPPVGTKISFSLSRAARVQLAFFSPKPGRKVKRRCVAPTRKNRKARKCTRLVLAGSISFNGHAGKNTVRFQGRISKTKKLKPGRYQLQVTATDPTTPRRSPSRTATFTVVKG